MLQQGANWTVRPNTATVGDSVRVSAAYSVQPGTAVRVGELEPSDVFELLEPPKTETGGTTVRVSYTVALFATGPQAIPTPELELVDPQGRATRIAVGEVMIQVESVLPAGDSAPEVKPGFDPIQRKVTRVEPLVYLVLGVSLLSFVFWSIYNRSPLDAAPPDPGSGSDVADLEMWAAAGETTTVAELGRRRLVRFLVGRFEDVDESHTTAEIMKRLEARTDDLPFREIRDLFAHLDQAAFAPAHRDNVAHLVAQVDDLVAELEAPEGGVPDNSPESPPTEKELTG